jgi:hypothetical protein
MQPIDVILSLAAASSRVRKDQILMDAYAANCLDFFESARLAYDPFINFGVKSVAEIVEDDGAPGSLTFAGFRLLCEQLQTQTLIGDAARHAVHMAAEQCHAVTWNALYRRILLKNLRVVEASEVNRVLHRLGALAMKHAVPIFRYQTATDSPANPTKGQYLVDVQISGERLFAVLDKTAMAYNSKGEKCESYPQIEQALRSLAARSPRPTVMDGVLTATGEYVIFDMIPLIDFRAGLSAKTQRQRRTMLETLQISGVFSGSCVRVLPQIEINFATDDGKRAFAEFTQQAIDQGHHSVVLKKPEAPYLGKSNRAWLRRRITIT